MKKLTFLFAVVGGLATVSCGSDEFNEAPPPSSDPGVIAPGAPQGIERSRQGTLTEADGPAAPAGGGAPSSNPVAPPAGSSSPTTNPSPTTIPSPPVDPSPPATDPTPSSNTPAGADPQCVGKSAGDSCAAAVCQSQTHILQSRCDSTLKCVAEKVKCEDACENGACVGEKPGKDDDSKGEGKEKP